MFGKLLIWLMMPAACAIVLTWVGVGPHVLVVDEGKQHEAHKANNVECVKDL